MCKLLTVKKIFEMIRCTGNNSGIRIGPIRADGQGIPVGSSHYKRTRKRALIMYTRSVYTKTVIIVYSAI